MMKSKADEEEYWNSSKYKAFTFDDDDDEFSRVRNWGPPLLLSALGKMLLFTTI